MPPVEPNSVGLPSPQPETELSLHDVIRLVIDHIWLILVICAATTACAYWFIKNTPVEYKSKAVLIAEFKDVTLMDFKRFEGEDSSRSLELLNTIATSVTRTEVLKKVAQTIRKDAELRNWSTNDFTRDENLGELVSELSSRIAANVRRQTRFIDVTAIDGIPDYSRKLAQTVVEQYIAAELEGKQGTGIGTTKFLNSEVERLRTRLNASEAQLGAFLRTNPISANESDDLASSDLKNLNTQLLAARSDRLRLESDVNQIKETAEDVEKLLTIPSVLESPQVAELRKQVLENENAMVNLQQRYKAKHPKMIEATSLLDSLNEKLKKEVQRAPKTVELALKKATLKELQLAASVSDAQKQVSKLNVFRMEYNKIKGAADFDRELYANALKRSRESEINVNILQREDAEHNVRIFEDALTPGNPFKPNKKLIVVFALVLGLSLSGGIIFLIDLLDTTVKSVDQAERFFGIPVLGSIPRSGDVGGDRDRLILSADPNSLCAEAFRTLRAAIGLLGREGERKVTLFTSAVPSEGKTFCSSNFALAGSKQGKKTLIVDFDLRRPSVGKTFGIEEGTSGVSDCLLGKTTIGEAAIATEYENLHVMTAGTMVPNPSELISSVHTREFIEEARSLYDQVVIDNAPVTAVSDTLLILTYVDTVCLVSRAAKTSHRLIARALELIRRGGVVTSGLVLNFVPQKGRSGYYYYASSDKSYYGGYGKERGSSLAKS